jgi:uncharacterized membrane protein YqiK
MHISTPTRVGRSWVFPDGKILPVVSGGADEGDPPATGNEPPPSTEPTSPPATEPPPADTAAEVAKWKELARKHEERAKQNAKAAQELEQLKAQSLSETEKAIEAAKAEGRSEAETRLRERIILAEVKARQTADPQLVAMLVDRSTLKWDDGGELDEESLEKAINKVLKERPILATREGVPTPKVPTGARGTEQPDPGSMTMSEYMAWRKANPHA